MACRWCGGDGVSPDATPRQAGVLRERIVMKRGMTSPERFPPLIAAGIWVGQVSHMRSLSSDTLHRPLAELADSVEQRLALGYEFVSGDVLDRALACERCGGTGDEPSPTAPVAARPASAAADEMPGEPQDEQDGENEPDHVAEP